MYVVWVSVQLLMPDEAQLPPSGCLGQTQRRDAQVGELELESLWHRMRVLTLKSQS